jgi:hypothetical protein
VTWLLLLPNVVERAQMRVTRTPWKSFLLGAGALIVAGIPIALLNAAAGPLQFIGIVSAFVLLTIVSIGAAGVAAMMGERLRGQGVNATTPGALVRGAIALEFAMVFPLVGWFIVLPLVALASLGAAVFAFLRWGVRASPVANRVSSPVTSSVPLSDAR